MCTSIDTFLATLPEFASVGGPSTATIAWLGEGAALDTIDIGGLQLVAVAGARTAGSLTWSVDGNAVAEASSFVAAIADSEAADVVTAVKITPTTVKLTTFAKGANGLLYLGTSDPLVYSLSGAAFAGGTALLELQLASACSMVQASVWKTKTEAGRIYLAAHMLAVATGLAGGETGVTTSRTIDRISQGNAATSFDVSDAAFASTKWGRMYIALRDSILVLPTTSARGWCGR